MTARREFDAFVEALDATPPDAVTACAGWTAHELVAHLVSGVEAIAEQVEAHLDGRPIPEFGSFADRERALWGEPDQELRERLVAGERRMTLGLEREAAAGPEPAVPGIGWGMPIRDVALHLRQEFAVHRWDLVGDDAEGDALLARPELIDHAVRMLAEPLLAAGDPAVVPGEAWTLRIRAGDGDDLVVTIAPDARRLELVPQTGTPDIECDLAARLLLLWGRRPARAGRVRTRLDAESLRRAQLALSGF